jgi:urate oxidase
MTDARISYGKLEVPVYRVRGTELFACIVSMEVLGQGFLAAYTEGDNRAVVATDTMKNVIVRQTLGYGGDTLDGLLEQLGAHFLGAYPEMEGLRLWARAMPFAAAGERLYSLEGGDHAVAELELAPAPAAGVQVVDRRGGIAGMRLLKTTGSAFTKFARDDATTLPERGDRPLFIHLDVHWRCADPADHVDPAAVRAVVLAVFDRFVSESIQHLVHEMGTVLLADFPALAEVSFRGENHTPDPVHPPETGDADPKAYTAAFPAWGLITLTLTR